MSPAEQYVFGLPKGDLIELALLFAMGVELTIKSSRSSGNLKFTERQASSRSHPVEYVRVSLEDHELAASSSRVYLYEPKGLVAFFDELAREWRGWDGEKEWKSVEGDFALSGTANGLGLVTLRVVLRSGLYEEDWSVEAAIHVDAGQLEDLALKARAFFMPSPVSNTSLDGLAGE